MNVPDLTIIFHDQQIKFHDFPRLENKILEFHDFPGFQWPVRALSKAWLALYDLFCRFILYRIFWGIPLPASPTPPLSKI